MIETRLNMNKKTFTIISIFFILMQAFANDKLTNAVDCTDITENDVGITSSFDIDGIFGSYNNKQGRTATGVRRSYRGFIYGVEATLTKKFSKNWFSIVNGNYKEGLIKYRGFGTMSNREFYYEIRALTGYDFIYESFSIAPYLGLGFRCFYNLDEPLSSLDYVGYDKRDQYWYIPIGFFHHFKAKMKSAYIISNIEVDYFIRGFRYCYYDQLKNASKGYYLNYGNEEYPQKKGFGCRGSCLLASERFAVGPYLIYWLVGYSNYKTSNYIEYLNNVGTDASITERILKNYTMEIGAKGYFRF